MKPGLRHKPKRHGFPVQFLAFLLSNLCDLYPCITVDEFYRACFYTMTAMYWSTRHDDGEVLVHAAWLMRTDICCNRPATAPQSRSVLSYFTVHTSSLSFQRCQGSKLQWAAPLYKPLWFAACVIEIHPHHIRKVIFFDTLEQKLTDVNLILSHHR